MLSVSIAVAAIGLSGLLLAMFGLYTPVATVLIALLPTVAGTLAVHRALGTARGAAGRHHHAAAAAAVLLAMSATLWYGWAPSQHVLINRDPGSYVATARWLDRSGSLVVEQADAVFADAGVGDLEFDSYAAYEVGDGDVQFQFNHLLSVLLAIGYGIGGQHLMFRVPALLMGLGLLVVYAVSVRVLRHPGLGLIAPASIAVSMPVLYVARDAYSESATLVLLWASLLAGLVAHRTGRWSVAAVAGSLLGATVATRVDAVLYLAVAAVLCASWIGSSSRSADPGARAGSLRCVGALYLGAAIGMAIGFVDLFTRTGDYVDDLSGEQLLPLQVFVAVVSLLAAAGTWVWCTSARLRGVATEAAARASGALAATAVAVMLLAWWVRPLVQRDRGAVMPLVGSLQAREGVEVDPTRLYSEHSLHWMAWYLGAAGLLAAIVGIGMVVHRASRGRATPAAFSVLVLLVFSGGVYWIRPSITPDQIWAMRRFVPAVLPALAVMATVPVAAIVGGVRGRGWRTLAATGMGAVLVVVPARVTWPVRDMSEQRTFLGSVEQTCELIGADAAVLVLLPPASDVVPQTLRSWCGVPVAAAAEMEASELTQLRDHLAEQGTRLAVVTTDVTAASAAATELGASVVASDPVTERFLAERTIERVPASPEPQAGPWQLYVVR